MPPKSRTKSSVPSLSSKVRPLPNPLSREMARTIDTDVAIIGAGTAGLNARREARTAGARTLLIESGPYGTTCARVGCMPSKLLIAAADAAHHVAYAGRFGIRVRGRVVDGPAVLE